MIIHHKMKIIDAAQSLGIRYENAKAIWRVYQLEGRFTKKIFKKQKKDYKKTEPKN